MTRIWPLIPPPTDDDPDPEPTMWAWDNGDINGWARTRQGAEHEASIYPSAQREQVESAPTNNGSSAAGNSDCPLNQTGRSPHA